MGLLHEKALRYVIKHIPVDFDSDWCLHQKVDLLQQINLEIKEAFACELTTALNDRKPVSSFVRYPKNPKIPKLSETEDKVKTKQMKPISQKKYDELMIIWNLRDI